ncbi:MAG: polysaccharide deacetylase family protein, partial [Ilumatobacteraceae bacterium]
MKVVLVEGARVTSGETGLKQVVKRVSRAIDRILPPAIGITVLIYHRVGGRSPSAVDLDPVMFDDQLAILAAEHRVLTLAEALAELAGPSSGWGSEGASSADAGARVAAGTDPRPGVVLTFDDGTSDFTEVAVPLLVRHGLPATLYAATQFIDSGEPFPWGAPPTSWNALRDAMATGLISVGSHTHSHWLLDRLQPAAIADDLDRSIELIGAHLGTAP